MITIVLSFFALLLILFVALYWKERQVGLRHQEQYQQLLLEQQAYHAQEAVMEERLRLANAQEAEAKASQEELLQEKSALERNLYLKEAEIQQLNLMLETLQTSREKEQEEMQLRFQQMATQIIEERSQQLGKRNEETLLPLREGIERLNKRVEETYSNESRERLSLERLIRELQSQSNTLTDETNALVRALKGDSKVQGDWGEMILENILKTSGLREGEEYSVQEVLRDDEGNIMRPEEGGSSLRPDVVVHYPNGGDVIIDSKVSLTAYSNYIAADTDADRAHYAKAHLQSVRNHIDELAAKGYQHYSQKTPNFVLLFIPNDPAYSLALTQAPSLWEEAYKRGVVLINATNLIAVLRMAQDMWQRDRQIKNVEEIVKRASALYDKFCLHLENLNDAAAKFESAQDCLLKARKQLSEGNGNVLRQMEQLKELGLKPRKQLPISSTDV